MNFPASLNKHNHLCRARLTIHWYVANNIEICCYINKEIHILNKEINMLLHYCPGMWGM